MEVLVEKAKEKDMFAVALLLQPDIAYKPFVQYSGELKSHNTPLQVPLQAQQLAAGLVDDLILLKASIDAEWQLDVKVLETLWWLSRYKPIASKLAELGAFNTLFAQLSYAMDSDFRYSILKSISTLLDNTANSNSYIIPQHIDILLRFYSLTNAPNTICGSAFFTSAIIHKLIPTSISTIIQKMKDLLDSPSPSLNQHFVDLIANNQAIVEHLSNEGAIRAVVNTFTSMDHFRTTIANEWVALRSALVKDVGILLENLSTPALLAPSLQILESLDCPADKIPSNLINTSIIPLLCSMLTMGASEQIIRITYLFRDHMLIVKILGIDGILQVLLGALEAPNKRATNLLLLIDRNVVCAAVAKTRIPLEKLPGLLQVAMFNYMQIPPISRDKQAPWYIDPAVLVPVIDDKQKFVTLPGQPKDLEVVTSLYQRCPVPGYDIKSVTIVYSEHLFNSFTARIESLQQRTGKDAFTPHWKNDIRTSSQERAHRKRTMDLFHSLATFKYNLAPDVSFVLGWHGTRKAVLESLFSAGFANLASTDAGFFGKGLYTTPDAEYAFRVYSSGALLLNWVATFSPFPVIAQDEAGLAEKGNYRNYDAHFVPVYSPNHPKANSYHACEHNEIPQYSEMVVFESSQMLASYVVELQTNMPQEISPVKLNGDVQGFAIVPKKDMTLWSVTDVCAWLATLQLTQDYSALLQQHNISGEVLQTMTQQDWKDVGMTNFGDSRLVALKVSRYE